MTRLALLAGAVLLVVAGCGGGGSQRAIREALARSPQTYLHYGRRWWGAAPRVTIRRLDVKADRATAVVVARRSRLAQTVRLRRRDGRWHVATASVGFLVGPREARPPTAAERAAIVADARRRFRRTRSCITYQIVVSRLDRRYALVDYVFPHPLSRRCLLFNGNSLYRRGPHGWHEFSGASSGYPCALAPAGVIRSLDGGCMLPTR